MKPASHKYAVLGGGILGQVLALRLREAGHQVTILEAAPEAGGLAGAWTVGGVTCDIHYHVVLPGDTRLRRLLDELGLADSLKWERSRTGFFANGRLSPINSGLDYLRLPVLGPIAKLRVAALMAVAARMRDGSHLDRIRVSDWLRRWCGEQAFEALWRPLLRAKLGSNHERASATFIWTTMRRLYLARSAGAKTEKLGFIDGGYARVLQALRNRLEERGVALRTGCRVTRVEPVGTGFRIETADSGTFLADRVVSTLHCGVTARLCSGLSPEIVRRLEGVVYQGIVCAAVLLDRGLSPNYLTYLTDEDLPFTAIVETSALTGTAAYGGRHLVYLPRYVTQDDPYWTLDDATIRARFERGIARVHPDFRPKSIVDFRLSKVRNVMAVPTLGYRDTVPSVETNLPGLTIASSAQISDGTLNVNETLGVVERALPAILKEDPVSERDVAA